VLGDHLPLQLLQEYADSDGEGGVDDGPSSEEKPAGRRSKKARRNEDSDFEVGMGVEGCRV